MKINTNISLIHRLIKVFFAIFLITLMPNNSSYAASASNVQIYPWGTSGTVLALDSVTGNIP